MILIVNIEPFLVGDMRVFERWKKVTYVSKLVKSENLRLCKLRKLSKTILF